MKQTTWKESSSPATSAIKLAEPEMPSQSTKPEIILDFTIWQENVTQVWIKILFSKKKNLFYFILRLFLFYFENLVHLILGTLLIWFGGFFEKCANSPPAFEHSLDMSTLLHCTLFHYFLFFFIFLLSGYERITALHSTLFLFFYLHSGYEHDCTLHCTLL